jgi:hypothetical protein
MIPLLLTAIGAYLIGDSIEDNQSFAYGGFVRKGNTFRSKWKRTNGEEGYDNLKVIQTNKTSDRDCKTKVTVLEIVDSSDKSRIGDKYEETSNTIHVLLKNNLYERV